MRRTVTMTMIVIGLVLMVVSYFAFAAPWGATRVENADPRVPFAGLFFVIGILLTFSAALVYELMKDTRATGGD